jgi:hypothetical protein
LQASEPETTFVTGKSLNWRPGITPYTNGNCLPPLSKRRSISFVSSRRKLQVRNLGANLKIAIPLPSLGKSYNYPLSLQATGPHHLEPHRSLLKAEKAETLAINSVDRHMGGQTTDSEQ